MEVYFGKCNNCPYVVATDHLTLLRQAGEDHCYWIAEEQI